MDYGHMVHGLGEGCTSPHLCSAVPASSLLLLLSAHTYLFMSWSLAECCLFLYHALCRSVQAIACLSPRLTLSSPACQIHKRHKKPPEGFQCVFGSVGED